MSSRNLSEKPSVPGNTGKKVPPSKTHMAKKRSALVDVTNQKTGSQSSWRTSVSSFKPMVPCGAKVSKTEEFSTCTLRTAITESAAPSSLIMKPHISSANRAFQKADQCTDRLSIPLSPSRDVLLGTPTTLVCGLRSIESSPSRLVTGSVSLDESMSTCDSLKGPEFKNIEDGDAFKITSIEEKTVISFHISGNAESKGNACKREIFEDMGTIDDISYVDKSLDPQFCATIACDIYNHLRVSEERKRPSTDFMERIQKDINSSMRSILIDWLVEVAEEYNLVAETLFLTINYIDRYLSGNTVNRQQLQLLGVSCIMIAAKYEEISAPKVEEFCYITDYTYSKDEVLQMESTVLNYLKFEMTAPTTISFLRRYICVAQDTSEVPSTLFGFLASYLAELSLPEYNMLCYAPSLIAAASTFLAKFILFPSKKPWNSTLRHYTLYEASDLRDCVKSLHQLCRSGQNSCLAAVREKYSQHKYKFVAKKYCPLSIPSEFFRD